MRGRRKETAAPSAHMISAGTHKLRLIKEPFQQNVHVHVHVQVHMYMYMYMYVHVDVHMSIYNVHVHVQYLPIFLCTSPVL